MLIYLEDIIQFTLGKNTTRINPQTTDIYTPDDFEKDLHSINRLDKPEECIINLIKSKAAPLSKETQEKCITSNFLRCSFDTSILDPWYFCYQFNAGKEIENQIYRFHQGNTLSVKKLNVQTIGKLQIPILDIKRQQQIGNIYKKAIIQKDLMLQQAENMETMALTIIRKIEED